ncbi:MAG: DUF3784 domain-containing protein [Alistipes sp.]|nr:DUF3784 domain-containing protein [Alistipes sp.]
MDLELIIGIVSSIVVLVLAFLVLAGLGDNLISGYNTASAEKRAKYDLPRLRLVTGLSVIVVTASVWLLLLFKASEMAMGVVMCVEIVFIALANILFTKK